MAITNYEIATSEMYFPSGPQLAMSNMVLHPPQSYLFISGKVKISNMYNNYFLIVKDSTKYAIKCNDSLFTIHMSPKFVTKVNDSTYTFKNQ